MTIFYFTATGNSLAVAKRIGGTLISIPQVVESDSLFFKDDVIGVVFPVYWMTAPDMVLKFIKAVKFECDYLFLVATSGGMPGASLHIVQQLAKKNGFRFDYLDDVVMIDNSLVITSIEAQIEKHSKDEFESKIDVILKNIAGQISNADKGTSIFKRALTSVVSRIPNYEKVPQKFFISDKCNCCKVCVKVCPGGNIEVSDKVRFGKRCTGCFACLHNSPENAIHFKNEKSTKRWRNPDVSLKDIIDANNRVK